jgi:hypothetical protein
MKRSVWTSATLVIITIDKQLVPTLLRVERLHTDLTEVRSDGATLVIAIVAWEVSTGDAALGIQNTWTLDRQWRCRNGRSRRARL